MKSGTLFFVILNLIVFTSFNCLASELTSANWIDNPYVQPLENEVEYQLLSHDSGGPDLGRSEIHQFGFGRALNDRWMIDAELEATSTQLDGLHISAVALELKTQLTEQGEYGADWGMVFEFEHELDDDISEIGATLIMVKQLRNWVGTINASLVYETGSDVKSEFETELSTLLKYRYRLSLEPGIEFHKSENTNAFGPSLTGQLKFGDGRSLFWGAAFLNSFDRNKVDDIIRLNVEFEFY